MLHAYRNQTDTLLLCKVGEGARLAAVYILAPQQRVENQSRKGRLLLRKGVDHPRHLRVRLKLPRLKSDLVRVVPLLSNNFAVVIIRDVLDRDDHSVLLKVVLQPAAKIDERHKLFPFLADSAPVDVLHRVKAVRSDHHGTLSALNCKQVQYVTIHV